MKIHTFYLKKIFISKIIILMVLSFLILGCHQLKPTAYQDVPINILQDPIQEKVNFAEPILFNNLPDFDCKLKPQAIYKISAIVAAKKVYRYGWTAKIAPIDLALIWGELTEPSYKKVITYSQSNRWYYFRYSPNCPLDINYISSHSANNHIIPANNNILRVIRSLRSGQAVLLEGYLVNLQGTRKGKYPIWWNSSLTRLDSGDGACELFYVNRVQIGKWVYE